MNQKRYVDITRLSDADALTELESGDSERISTALLSIGLHSADWAAAQQVAVRFLKSESETIVAAAVLSIAHSARAGKYVLKSAFDSLRELGSNELFAGRVQDAMDDITMFASVISDSGNVE